MMADRLAAEIATSPDDFFLVLTGNLHNRLDRGVPWDANYTPMGFALANRLDTGIPPDSKSASKSLALASYAPENRRLAPDKRLVSLAPYYYGGGEAWVCTTGAASSCTHISLPKWPKDASAEDDAPMGVRLLRGAVGSKRSRGYYS